MINNHCSTQAAKECQTLSSHNFYFQKRLKHPQKVSDGLRRKTKYFKCNEEAEFFLRKCERKKNLGNNIMDNKYQKRLNRWETY